MQGSLDALASLQKEHPNYITLSQFDNPDNPQFHYETTGKEILEQLPDVDILWPALEPAARLQELLVV